MSQATATTQRIGMRWGHALLLLSFFLFSYVVPLGVRDLLIPDETRYGEIPREMIRSGDWITPHLDGFRYFEKPVLGYWVHAGSLLLFGENNFAVRMPSALAVGLSALLVLLLAGRVRRTGSRDDAIHPVLAALVFMSCAEVFVLGNTALLDGLFSLFVTACVCAFYVASEAPRASARETSFLLLAGAACGLAFLTKGFLALAVPVLALVPYLIWERRYSDLLRMSWLPLLTAALVSLPWAIVIHMREPDFWHFFFWNEHVRRFMGDNAQHKEPFWFYLTLTPALFLPWIFMVPAAVAGVRDAVRTPGAEGRLARMAACWLVVPFLFFSLSSGKLLTYILPCFPPFAILMAFGLLRGLEKKVRHRLFRLGAMVNTGLFGLGLLAFLTFQLFGFRGVRPYDEIWKAVLVACGVAVCVALCLWALARSRAPERALFFGAAPLLLFFATPLVFPDATKEMKMPGPFLERHAQELDDVDVLISDEATITAACWYFKRSDVYVLGGGGELAYGAGYDDAAGRLLDLPSAVELINRHRGSVVLIGRIRETPRWREELPEPVSQDESGPSGYVLWRF